ncbi:hypothetical protein OJ997_12325 [Solirubrobacter phytolaccae]|uniref:Calcium-binding protein n=1 Tax=Solirubrobacter phytolaccae TaxID=1404360 RepID=A0A9X3SB86_9ACTN|nr:hypothetical protein [Solirubrobacter phytolaccae]MDA0181085.1 hypothetical protein [Solirubrobacter phytolaccae]
MSGMTKRGVVAVCGAVTVAGGMATTASAAVAEPSFTCRASVVRAQLLGALTVEPFAAKPSGCASVAGSPLPTLLTLDAAYATTVAPGDAKAGVATLTVPLAAVPLRIDGVTATAAARCSGETPVLSADSTIARVRLGALELGTDPVLQRVGTGLDGLPIGSVLRVAAGEEVRAAGTVTRRALHVTLTLAGTSLADVVVGEVAAGAVCPVAVRADGEDEGDFPPTTPTTPNTPGATNPNTPNTPTGTPSTPDVPRTVTLADLARLGVSLNHPCRNARYGGDRALVGTSRADRMVGTRTADRVFGFAAGDRLSGGSGADCVDGATGADRLTGAGGADYLIGGSGNDRLSGGAGADRLFGGAGNDVIVTGTGRDRVSAGPGNDRVDARGRKGRQIIDCGPGRDTVRLNRGDRQRRCEKVLRAG